MDNIEINDREQLQNKSICIGPDIARTSVPTNRRFNYSIPKVMAGLNPVLYRTLQTCNTPCNMYFTIEKWCCNTVV